MATASGDEGDRTGVLWPTAFRLDLELLFAGMLWLCYRAFKLPCADSFCSGTWSRMAELSRSTFSWSGRRMKEILHISKSFSLPIQNTRPTIVQVQVSTTARCGARSRKAMCMSRLTTTWYGPEFRERLSFKPLTFISYTSKTQPSAASSNGRLNILSI